MQEDTLKAPTNQNYSRTASVNSSICAENGANTELPLILSRQSLSSLSRSLPLLYL